MGSLPDAGCTPTFSSRCSVAMTGGTRQHAKAFQQLFAPRIPRVHGVPPLRLGHQSLGASQTGLLRTARIAQRLGPCRCSWRAIRSLQMSEEAHLADEQVLNEAAGIMARRALTQEPGAENDVPPGGPDKEEEDRENSRRYRRTVFTFQDWRNHRNAKRHTRHISGLLGSRIVRGLAQPLAYTATIATILSVYQTALEAHALPPSFGSLSVTSSDPFNLSSFALSLLLVFRTNTSYSRWLDARKIWGGVVNRSRDLVRQAASWFDPEQDAELLELLERWTIAFSKSLQTHLREDGDIEAELKNVLPAPELAALLASNHRPNYALEILSTAIDASTTVEMGRVRMDENVTFFSDAVGACERILKSPIPLSYTRHTSRFLVIWLTFMPFTLYHACGVGCIPASVTIAFFLLGIEEIGVQIEEPFGILPLEDICAVIERDCKETNKRRGEVADLVKVSRRRTTARDKETHYLAGGYHTQSSDGTEETPGPALQ